MEGKGRRRGKGGRRRLDGRGIAVLKERGERESDNSAHNRGARRKGGHVCGATAFWRLRCGYSIKVEVGRWEVQALHACFALLLFFNAGLAGTFSRSISVYEVRPVLFGAYKIKSKSSSNVEPW